jgi:hypothetical protein
MVACKLKSYLTTDANKCHRSIVDGRLSFTIIQGITITLGFAVQEELKHWDKMYLPNVENLKRKVAEMKCRTISMNFDFGELGT